MSNFIANMLQKIFYLIGLTTLTRQFFFSFIIIMVCGSLIMSAQFFTMGNDANAINMAGRQRMLTQHLAKDAFLVSQNIVLRSAMQKNIDLFELSHQTLLIGSLEKSIDAIKDNAILQQFDKVNTLWLSYKNTLENYVESDYVESNNVQSNDVESKKDKALLMLISQQSSLLLKEVNRAVVMMTDLSNKRIRVKEQAAIIATLLLMFLVWLGRIYANQYLMKKIDIIKKQLINVAQGDFSQPIPILSGRHQDEMDQTIEAYNLMLKNIGEMLSGVSATSDCIVAGAQQAQDSLSITTQDVQQQNDNLEQVVNAMDTISCKVEEVANTSKQSFDIANATENKAIEGQRVVTIAVENINLISKQVDEASSVMSELDKDSHRVGDVLEVITAIAEQTNLLALNAAIEAARAGDQGRGFAVVADEVRTLAQRTQESTGQIREIIDHLQSQAKSAVSVITDTKEKTDTSVQSASQANEMLHDIVQSVGLIRDIGGKIASAVVEQADITSDIRQRLVTISDLAVNTNSATQASVLSTDKINAEVNTLRELIVHFKK